MKKKCFRVKKKKLFFKFIAFFVAFKIGRCKFLQMENVPDEPCIFVLNHSKTNTPIMNELFFPVKNIAWCDAPMFDKKALKSYAYNAFWSGKPKWYQRILITVLAPIVQYVFNNADAMPVYRDMRVIKTYSASVKALKDGINLTILPECPTEHNEIINAFNRYFVDVARFYYKSTGKSLLFVPAYYGHSIRKTIIGKPIRFNPDADIETERNRVCDYLIDEITRVAKTLPSHTVIPYNNVKRKFYKKSK